MKDKRTSEEIELDRRDTLHRITTARIELTKYLAQLDGLKHLIKNKQEDIENIQEYCDHDVYTSEGFKACRICGKHIFKGEDY